MNNNPLHETLPENKNNAKPAKSKEDFSSLIMKHLNIIIPSLVVVICAIAVFFLVQNEIKNSNGINGEFVCATEDSMSRIVFEKNGNYTFFEENISSPEKGEWKADSSKIILTNGETGKSESAYIIDNKYIAFNDDDFLEGPVPDKNLFDAQFTAKDGTVYIFDSNGKCFTSEDGRNTELGGYITDGSFVVITIDSEAHTYLNCKDGLTPVFYTQI